MDLRLFDKKYIDEVIIPMLEQHYGFELTQPKYLEIFQDYSDTDYSLNDNSLSMPEADYLYFGELTYFMKPKNKGLKYSRINVSTLHTSAKATMDSNMATILALPNYDEIVAITDTNTNDATYPVHHTVLYREFIDTYLNLYLNTDTIFTAKPNKEFQTRLLENIAFNAIKVVNGEPEGYIKFYFRGYRFKTRA